MRKLIGLALLVVASTGITVSSAAAALPDIHLLDGDAYPVTISLSSLLVGTGFSTTVATLNGLGINGSITCTELSSLCGYSLTFKGEKEGKLPCKSGSEPAETVVVSGSEIHLVFTKLSPLTLGLLYLVKPVEVLCGPTESPDKVKIKIEGAVLGQVSATLGVDIESLLDSVKGEKGKQELTKYFNDEGKEVSASLKASFGLGFEAADLNVAEQLTLKPGKMIDLLG